MTSLFTRWIPSVTLAVWSAVLLGTYLSGRVTAFLHPSFRPGVLVAGIGLALLALFIASQNTPPECCSDASCTHPLSRSKIGRWLSFLILVVPASFAAWLSPETFSKQAFEQRGITTDATGLGERRQPSQNPPAATENSATTQASTTQASTTQASTTQVSPQPAPAPSSAPLPPATVEKTSEPAKPADPAANTPAEKTATTPNPIPEYLQRTPEGYVIAEVLDMLYSVQDSQLRKDFEGVTVQLTAQIMPEKNGEGRPPRFKAVRMFMTCCAADARPVATLVEVPSLPEVPEMTWVKIIGKATFPVENGKRTAVIQATSVQQTKPPEETMLY
jgi:uncharacterized repeat protein (TIGR03943 family)